MGQYFPYIGTPLACHLPVIGLPGKSVAFHPLNALMAEPDMIGHVLVQDVLATEITLALSQLAQVRIGSFSAAHLLFDFLNLLVAVGNDRLLDIRSLLLLLAVIIEQQLPTGGPNF
jgi:hypothetical protein